MGTVPLVVDFCSLFVYRKKPDGVEILGCTKTAQIRFDVVMHTCNLGTVKAESEDNLVYILNFWPVSLTW